MPSERKHKKLDVFDENFSYITSVGDTRFSDFPTYMETKGLEYAKKRRDLYHIRHKKDNKPAGKLARILLWWSSIKIKKIPRFRQPVYSLNL